MRLRTPRRLAESLSYSYLLLVGLYVLIALIAIFVFRYSTLWRDQWHIYPDYFEFPIHQALWTTQNGHRLVFPGLLILSDIHFFRATNVFLLTCIGLMNALAAFLLQATLPVRAGVRAPILVAKAFPFVLLFWLGMRADIAWGLGVHYSLPVVAVVGACVLLAGTEPVAATGRAWTAPRRLAGAVALAVVATFSFGNGMAIWPSLLAIVWWRRLSRVALAVLVIGGVTFTGLYLFGANPHSIDPVENILTRPLEVGSFAIRMLGSPAAHVVAAPEALDGEAAQRAAHILGWLGVLILGGCSLAAIARKPSVPPAWAARLGVMIFSLVTGLIIGVMRIDVSSPLEPRHLIWSLLFWATVVVHLVSLLEHLRSPYRRPAYAATGLALVLVALALIPVHLRSGLLQARASLTAAEAGLAVLLGVRDDQAVSKLFFHPPVVYAMAQHLESRRLSVFASDLDRAIGEPLGERFGPLHPGRCTGRVVGSEHVTGHPTSAWRVTGWAWDERRDVAPRLVVATDDDGMIQGLGAFTRPVPESEARNIDARAPLVRRVRRVSSILPAALGWDAGWFGYVRDVPDLRAVSFYAVLTRPEGVCRIEVPLFD